MDDKSTEELELERNMLKLQLLKIDKELDRRKHIDTGKENLKDTGLRDRKNNKIHIWDKVRLLTNSTKSSPFRDQKFATVVGVAHNSTRVKIGLISDNQITTDRIPRNLEAIHDRVID